MVKKRSYSVVVAALLSAAVLALSPQALLAQEMHLIDANGVTVGPVISLQDRFSGFIQMPKVLIATTAGQRLIVYGATNWLEGNSVLLFASSDCTEPAYLLDTSQISPLVPSAVIAEGPHMNLYIPISGETRQDVPIRTVQQANGDCLELHEGASEPIAVLPAFMIEDLSSLFAPPFRVE